MERSAEGLPGGEYVVTQLLYSAPGQALLAILDLNAVARQERRIFLRAVDAGRYQELALEPMTMFMEIAIAANAPTAYGTVFRWMDEERTHGSMAGLVRIDLPSGVVTCCDISPDGLVQLVGVSGDGRAVYAVMRQSGFGEQCLEFEHALVEHRLGGESRVIAKLLTWYA